MRGSIEVRKMIDLLILEQGVGVGTAKSGLVQLPEGAFVWHGHNMSAFFHIKKKPEEDIHSLLFMVT